MVIVLVGAIDIARKQSDNNISRCRTHHSGERSMCVYAPLTAMIYKKITERKAEEEQPVCVQTKKVGESPAIVAHIIKMNETNNAK